MKAAENTAGKRLLKRIDMVSAEKKRVDELSLFEEQMICIAKALVNNAKAYHTELHGKLLWN